MDMIPSSSTNNTRLHEKLQCLREMMEQLNSKANDIQNEVQNEELQARKKRKSEVTLWLQQVSNIEEKVQSIGTEVAQVGFFGRGKLWDKLEEMMDHTEQLLKQSEFPRGLLLDDDKHEGLELVAQKMEGSIPSRVLDEVWSCFERGESRVAIFGIGGVGKTSLAMQINNQVLKKVTRLFTCVYYVIVSQETSVFKLQSDIAIAVDLRLNYKDEPKRAAELRMGLAKREKCLLILDDVWEDITMEEVGVSVEGDGCRLLITTRDKGVCHKMNCFPVKMDTLSPDDSWYLFKKQLQNFETLTDEVKDIADLVAKECDGLPLGIITMARSMRGVTSVHGWRDALKRLHNPCKSPHDMKNKVFRILRHSYDRFYDQRHQKCFLFCALYPEDAEIERNGLISQLIGARLLDGANRKESIDEGHTLLDDLENASLLECVNKLKGRYVKMHDLVRDMAIEIVGSTGLLKGGKNLMMMPRNEEWINKDLEWVSLMDNKIYHIEGMMPYCPKISVMLLRENRLLRSVSDSFFVQMIGLKVLDLSCTDVQVLPDSISSMFNLNTLLLRQCRRLNYIPSLAKLTKLRDFDVESCSHMLTLPDGMEKLSSLEHLNLQWTEIQGMHEGIVKNLLNLERFLCHGTNVPLEELMSLRHLEKLIGVRFDDLNGFSRFVGFGYFYQLKTYHIVVMGNDYKRSAFDVVGINHVDTTLIINGVQLWWRVSEAKCHLMVPYNVHLLQFKWCSFGGGSLLDALPSLGDVTNLENCDLWNCKGIEYIIPERWTKPLQGFKNLKLDKVDEFGGLIREEVVRPYISFGIRMLTIKYCTKLNKLWMLNLDLPNLEEIEIGSCEQMEEIFATEKGGTVKLPKLRSLKLLFLQELRSICGNCKVFFPHLIYLQVIGSPKMKKIGMGLIGSRNSPSLRTIRIECCNAIKEIFTTENEAGNNKIHLPKLEELQLQSMPELRSICDNCEIFFPHLISLKVIDSPKMKRMGMRSHNLPSLRTIHIESCNAIEEIFAVKDEAGDNKIYLPNLEKLHLRYMQELRSICSYCEVFFLHLISLEVIHSPKMKKIGMVSRTLPSLTTICIESCDAMEELFAAGDEVGDYNFPKLEKLHLRYMEEMRSICGNCEVFFPHLISLEVIHSPKMKKIGMVSGNLPSLRTIRIQSCDAMEEIFTAEDEVGNDKIHLSKLEELHLLHMKELRGIFSDCEVFFPRLISLKVIDSPKMKIRMGSRNLLSLKRIYLENCDAMKAMFATEVEVGDNEIHLPKL